MLKSRFPDKSVELMIIANSIPRERRVSCEQHHIEAVEISEKKFRDVADETGYIFKSEATNTNLSSWAGTVPTEARPIEAKFSVGRDDFPRASAKTQKSWYFWKGKTGHGYFLAFVNAKGSCSLRLFKADGGDFLRREYKSGDYQANFSEYLDSAVEIYVTQQPNLERDCKVRLPSFVLSELRQQIPGK